jgi:2-oxoisovalerate dehydrogenase E2 component (dihydrolipoyl transacylase)
VYYLCLVFGVQPGDKIKSFDKLCEVQSDKATVEITSRYDGSVAMVYHEEGAIVKVTNPL